MSDDHKKIHRLLKILMLIQSGKHWTPEALAEECGVAKRTIFRYLSVLEKSGVPCFYDNKAKGYRVGDGFFMPPLALTFDEALAIVALGEHVGGQDGLPAMQAAERAIAKVRGQLPTSIRHAVEPIVDHMAIALAKTGPFEGIEDVYETVRQAIAQKKKIRCQYESLERMKQAADSSPEWFEFSPYTLYFGRRAWYVIGYHGNRGEVRSLKLSRFVAKEITDENYEVPSDFVFDDYIGLAWCMIRGKENYEVELHFDAGFAETVADTCWHSTQEIHWQDDDSMIFKCTVAGLDEIVWWILSMGPHCVVRKPQCLAMKVRQLAEEIVNVYSPSKSTKKIAQ